jgi:GNAT superfamily N-acetyltransferase
MAGKSRAIEALGLSAIEHIAISPGKTAAVVTSLEMLARPRLREAPTQLDLRLERATHPAIQWYRELYRRVGEDWLWFSRLTLDDEALRAILDDPLVEVYALRHAGEEAGLLELDFRDPGLCELAFFGLVPALIGSGAGRWLMNRAVDLAWSRPIGRFWVHTCTCDHPGAVRFYMRSGFSPFRQHVEILDDPRLDGTLPRNAAAHVPIIESVA